MEILKIIPAYFLMLISLTGFLSGEMTKCEYSRNVADSHNGLFRFTGLVSLICGVLFWGMSCFDFGISLYTLWMALFFGLAVMGQITASAFAMKIGPWAYTAVMMSLSTIIPALSGVFFWGEKLTVNIVVGIILMSVCFIFSVKTDEEDKEKKKGNLRWLILSITASLCTGGIGILQKAHQTSVHREELSEFLAIAFTFSALFSLAIMLITTPKKENIKSEGKNTFQKKAFLLIFAAGIGTLVNHLINLYLSGAMESGIFFPIMSGGELIFVTLSSILIFKEKLSVKQWIGLVCGIVAVVVLCI